MEFLDSKFTSVNKNQYYGSKALYASKEPCPLCNNDHKLYQCSQFINESVNFRREFANTNKICFRCLEGNHSAQQCGSKLICRICKKTNHHTLVHNAKLCGVNVTPTQDAESHVETEPSDSVVCFSEKKNMTQILLATALIKTMSSDRQWHPVRALLDQGSQSSFVTEMTVQRLGLKRTPIKTTVTGVGGKNNLIINGRVTLKICSRFDSSFVLDVEALIIKSITGVLPNVKVGVAWDELLGMELADPEFNIPNRIDVLLGAEVYGQVIQDGIKRGPFGSPTAQCTTLGWIVSGAVVEVNKFSEQVITMHSKNYENELLKRFWELEDDIPMAKENMYTDEENRCEKFFKETTTRDLSGRYVVQLPFKFEKPEVENSLVIAKKRFYALEHKFKKDINLKDKYGEVINEYLYLNHMEEIPYNEIRNTQAIYLPHHCVIKEDRDTTKLRVVFDASCKGANNMSLNSNLLIGPSLQSDLRHILLRWRCHMICLTGDIVKMYRQIKVKRQDADYQRILWRSNIF